MSTEDNRDIETSTDEDDHDLAMVPPVEKVNAETDMDSDAWYDMSDGLVHHLPRRLVNSTFDWSLLDKGNKQKSVQPTQPPNKNNKNISWKNLEKRRWFTANFETIKRKCYTGRMERNNQVTNCCVQSYIYRWLSFACDKSNQPLCSAHGKDNLNMLEFYCCQAKFYIEFFIGQLHLTDIMKQSHVQRPEIDFKRYYQTFTWLTTHRLQKIHTTKYKYYLKSWISISNSMVHLSITALTKVLSLTMENTAQKNLLEESPLGLGLNFGASPHLKDISFMQNHTVEKILICQILVWIRVQMLRWVWLKSVR